MKIDSCFFRIFYNSKANKNINTINTRKIGKHTKEHTTFWFSRKKNWTNKLRVYKIFRTPGGCEGV